MKCTANLAIMIKKKGYHCLRKNKKCAASVRNYDNEKMLSCTKYWNRLGAIKFIVQQIDEENPVCRFIIVICFENSVLFFRLQYELDSLMEESMEIKPGIPEFFRGRSIFITGATGFMGKVLLEKLLRSCPELGTIYLLMRAKRGQQPEQRLNDLIQSKVN